MSSIVVDTNILSYELKRDTRAVIYTPHLQNQTLAISFVTLAELSSLGQSTQLGHASPV